MPVIDKLENEKGEEQIKACLVIKQQLFKGIQSMLIDNNVLISLKERLIDLSEDNDCNLYIIDTTVKDIDTWPMPLYTIPNAKYKDWLFLVSNLSDTSFIKPLPQNARFLNRNQLLSIAEFVSAIKKQSNPDSRKRFSKVKYLEVERVFLCWMENGKIYALHLAELPEADLTEVLKWHLSSSRDYIAVTQVSGNEIDIPWDDVLYHCEPQYEFYKDKTVNNINADANNIAKKIKKFREDKGYSIQALADKTKMKRSNLSRLEHGHHQPSLETLERIANALEIPVFELIRNNPI